MMKTIFKTVLVLVLIATAQVSMADFAACPSAVTAQAYVNSAAANLKEQTSPVAGWHFYQAIASDGFTKVNYYTQVVPGDNLGDHVKYLTTFMQGDAATPVDLPANAATVRHCYYPAATGSLDANANPLVPSVIVPGLAGKAQVLAIEYGAGTPPGPVPPTTNINVKVTLQFPVTPPATVNQYSVTLINPHPITGQPATFVGASTSASGVTITNVPVSASGAAYTYTYQATGIAFSGQDYCAADGNVDLSTVKTSLTITYTACSTPPPASGQVYAYYTNWSVYGRNFTPTKINYDPLTVVLYAFEQLGNCAGRSGTPSHNCFSTTGDFGFSGIQDYQLYSSDSFADYTHGTGGDWGSKGTIDTIINAAHAKSKKVVVSIGGYSLSDQLRDLMDDEPTPGCNVYWQQSSPTNPQPLPTGSHALRQRFIDSLWGIGTSTVQWPLLKNHQFDGVDIDFEPNGNHWGSETASTDPCYPKVSANIIQNYAQFLVDLKTALTTQQPGRDKLTIALTANPDDVKIIANTVCNNPTGSGTESCLVKIANAVDTINVMAYDYRGGWEANASNGATNFSSPLYADEQEPQIIADHGKFNVDATIQAYKDAGVAMNKLVLGIPTYARIESGVGSGTIAAAPGLYSPFTGTPDGEYNTWDSPDHTGVYDYKCVMAFFGSKFGIAPTPAACQPSLIAGSSTFALYMRTNSSNQLVGAAAYTPTGHMFFSLDVVGASNMDTITPKINYVKANGIAGVMFWELAGDLNPTDYTSTQYQQYSLIYNANQQLNGSTTTVKK